MQSIKFNKFILFILSFIFTLVILFNELNVYKNAVKTKEDILKSTAYFIGLTLSRSLNLTGLEPELFLDIMKKQHWEHIAYIALYDRNNTIALHSNQRLIGSKYNDKTIKADFTSKYPVSYYKRLKTDELVYIMDMPINIPAKEDEAMSLYLLTVALHTYPANKVVRDFKTHGVILFFITAFMWILTIYLYRYSRKAQMMEAKSAQREHLLLLGQMSSVLAHEIRSPLSAIKGFAQLMLEKIGTKDDKLKKGLTIIVDESSRLENLTSDLLVYAKDREVSEKTETFRIKDLIEELCAVYLQNSTIELRKTYMIKNETVATDRGKLKQVLINIIQNALESSYNNLRIDITVINRSKAYTISIKDTGRGMDEETLKNAQKPFYTTKTKGTGLGLAIAAKLIRLLDGDIHITSTPDIGTEVRVTFKSRA
ncbi:membrane protein containing ATP-binding region, ATPase-like domain protein [Candidatus Magnetoovum chiemensis]|nr:membrane protein containing ATP-binding region, ATPase-like domain protein [Candidatus Magnetoovum chiemensis]